MAGSRDLAVPIVRARRRRLVDEVRDLIVEDFIASGAIGAGEKLPSEKELSERYGVSRVTLRACIRSLEESGLVMSRHGVGSIVLPGTTALLLQGFERLGSLETFARERGRKVTTVDVAFERSNADAAVAGKLEVAVGHPVLSVSRAKLVGDVRAAWLVDHVPEGTLPFEVIESEFEGSTLDVLLAHPLVGLEFADTEIQAVNVPAAIARRISVTRGTAVVYTDALARTSRGGVVEWAQAWMLPEHFRFAVRRRRR